MKLYVVTDNVPCPKHLYSCLSQRRLNSETTQKKRIFVSTNNAISSLYHYARFSKKKKNMVLTTGITIIISMIVHRVIRKKDGLIFCYCYTLKVFFIYSLNRVGLLIHGEAYRGGGSQYVCFLQHQCTTYIWYL